MAQWQQVDKSMGENSWSLTTGLHTVKQGCCRGADQWLLLRKRACWHTSCKTFRSS